MKILVTFAVDAEFDPWRARHKFDAVRLGEQTVYQARIGGAEVAAVLTGIGPKIAASNVLGILMSGTYDLCISAGLAGALRPEYAAGEILAASCVSLEEEGARLREGSIPAHPVCLQLAGDCGATLAGKFRTSARLILTAREKSELAATADAVEMESFEVLTAAMAWGAHGIAIRAVGDTAEEDLPLDFNQAMTPQGAISTGRIAGALLKRPSALPGLFRFARQSRDAAIELGNFLDRYITALANVPASEWEVEEAVAAT